MAYKKILVALDGSELAEAALDHAQKLASDPESEIVLIRVSVDPAAEFSFSDPHIADNIIIELETETLAYVQSVRSKLQRAGFRTSFLIHQGPIAETILQTAAEIRADRDTAQTEGPSVRLSSACAVAGASRVAAWSRKI